MKLLVIGGSGQLSGRLAAMAAAQGHEVYALTRGIRPLPPGVKGLTADRNDPAQMERALSDLRFDAALDCICMNARHARTDLDVLPKHTGRLVIVSTDSVYHPAFKTVPQDENGLRYLDDGGYGANKRQMEEVFLTSEENWTIYRPGHIFGPGFDWGCFPEHSRQKDLPAHIRSGKPLRLVGGGTFLIHPIFADDLAQTMLSAIPNEQTFRQIYCIGGPEVMTNARYYEILGEVLGHPVTIEPIPLEGYLESHPEYSGHLCDRSYDLSKLLSSGQSPCQTTLREAAEAILIGEA